MQLTDKDGNIFGTGGLEITTSTGKPKIPVINTDITIGTTTIVGGVSGRLLYDDAGIVGETAGINWNPITSALSLFDSPFNSQAGNVSANTSFSITGTASSNYTIYSSRQFIFNTGQSMYFNTDTDGGSALDRAWYFAGARTGITGGRTYGALTVDSSGFPNFTLYNNDNGARILLASNATSYFNGGNILIGTTTDAGFKLDVIGSTRVTSLKTADIFPASANISLWTNSLNASSRFYTAPVHQDGRINFNAIAGGSDQVLIRAWHTGQFGLGTGSSSAGGALTVRGDSLLIGTAGALYFMNGTFGPNNVPYRLAISTTATTTSFYSGVTNNLTNIESTKFEYTATSHTFYTGTTAGNQANPKQYTPLHLSNLGNVTIGSTTDAGFRLDVNGTSRIQGVLTAAGNYIQYGTNPNVGIGSTNNGNSFVNNGPALLYASANINATQVYAHNFFTGSFNSTSGVQGLANLTGANFSPTSGTAVFNTINATPTINQTGGASGITRGLYINPTLTAAADFRAIETTAGSVIFNGPTTISNRYLYHQGASAIQYFMTSNAWSGTNSIFFGDDSSATIGSLTYNHQFDSFAINVNGGNRIQIPSTGNVLINTTTDAGYKLDVVGTAIIGDSSNYGTVFKVRTPGSGWNFDYQYLSLGTVLKLGLDRLELRVNNNTAYIGNNGDSSNASLTVMSGHDAAATSFAPIIFGSGRNASLTREVMRIDNQNKYVGIGTTNPIYNLEVVSSTGYAGIGIRSAQNNNAELSFQNAGYSLPRWTIRASGAANGSSGSLVFQRNASTFPMVITSGDNVLIGTSIDSGYKLNVNGIGYFNSRVDLSANSPLTLGGGGNNQAGVSLWGTQNASNGWDGWIGRNLEYNGTNYIYKTTNANNYWGTVAGIRTLGAGNLALGFIARPATEEGANVIATDLNTYTRLAILYNGNVGIGTTNPTTSLDVNGTVKALYVNTPLVYGSGDLDLAAAGGTTGILIKNATRNVLINTIVDNGYKLDVNGTSRFTQALTVNAGGIKTESGTITGQTGVNSGRMTMFSLNNTGGGYLAALNSSLAIGFQNRSAGALWSADFIELKVYDNSTTTSTTGYNFYTHNQQGQSTAAVLAMSINGQSIGIGVEAPNASAKLQVESTTQGFLPPRMTNDQMLAIATPAEGLVVYDLTNRKLCCYDGATWQPLF